MALLALVLACGVLAGCMSAGSGSGSQPPKKEKQEQLRSKIPLLQADECYKGDPSTVYTACDKYVTELASTVGALRNTLASEGPDERKAVNGLEDGLQTYQQLGCGVVKDKPSGEQQHTCPRALVKIHNSLDTLNSAINTASSAPSSTPSG